jgi:putative peptide zinc metalloprotease protein
MSRPVERARSPIFSDSWHRVAELRCALRRTVGAQRQAYQGEDWVVLRDTLSNDWFRVGLAAYQFLARLNLQVTVEEAWQDSLQALGERALTQEDVVQLLGQLNLSNLLVYDRTPSAVSLFERYRTRRRQEFKALLMGFLAIKIPLWDPDQWLQRQLPFIRKLFSRAGALAYATLLLAGVIAVVPQTDRLFDQASNVLAPDNLFLLYVGFVLAKLVHELGHAAMCKHHGGEVHTVGVMLLLFAPLPYVDASSAWGFRSHWHRFQVGAAGMFSEFAVAAAAALVWTQTAPGTLNAVAYNVMFVASISSLLFNLNPLLRFDGYHMLVDMLQIPNLYQRAREQLKFLCEHLLFGLSSARPAASNRREALLLPLYGIGSLIYWVFLMLFISVFVANQYLELGMAMVLVLLVTSVFMPLGKFLRFLFTSPRLAQHRRRALGVTGGFLGLFLFVTAVIESPEYIRVDGVLQAQQHVQVNAASSGVLVKRGAELGQRVEANQVLLELSNPALELERAAAERELAGLRWQAQRATAGGQVQLRAIQEQIKALDAKITLIDERLADLTVRAPGPGIWVGGDFGAQQGQWVKRGQSLGEIVNPDAWTFVGVLPQVDTFLFERDVEGAQVRLRGQEAQVLDVTRPRVIPHENGVLPSAALGMAGGGPIAVDPSDGSGTTAREPFFRLESDLLAGDGPAFSEALKHGLRGTLRVQLSDAPLWLQWERRVRQFLQRSFRV